MLKQTVYVGPLQIEIEYDNECINLCFDPIFERKTNCRHTIYRVKMESLYECIHPEKINYEGNNFDESLTNSEIKRYVYQIIDGKKHYYAQTILKENMLLVKINIHTKTILGRSMEVWRFLMLEKLLLKENAMILHSSSIIWKNQAILFSAPSGTGKTTQAELWKKYDNNVIGLNGDRNLLYYYNDTWYVCGLPWHGSSKDCISVEVPLKAIAVIRQSKIDKVQIMSVPLKIQSIYNELTLNNWDRTFAEQMTELVEKLITNATIIQLNCTMAKSAVDCLKKHLEE